MKTRFPLSIVTTIFAIALIMIIAMPVLMLTPVAVADIIPVSSIKDDTHIGKEVTVSGVVVTISSNIDPASILIHEPGDTSIIMIDDGSGRMLVSSDPRLFKFHEGERITVMGLYAGENLIYADRLSKSIERGYKDITIAELNKCPVCYYDASVRIEGKVARMEFSTEKTDFTIDDDTGTMDVEYRGELVNIRINDDVVVEGKFYRSKIYAFTVMLKTNQTASNQSITPESEGKPHPTVAPDSSIIETPASAPAKTVKIFTSPLFIGLVILSVAVVVGIFVSIKVREWLMLKRYMK
jgi:cytochrome c-type biogenesis protein CcmE